MQEEGRAGDGLNAAHEARTASRQTVFAQARVARLAACLPVHRAFHWLHLHEAQLRLWQLEMLRIPAPPFGEAARAAWFLERFRALGLSNVHLDGAGNALAELPAADAARADGFVVLSAHLDTVFPAAAHTVPSEEGARIVGPGACDNAAGLTGLLGIAAALQFARIAAAEPILFAANVGEEGEGNLRGMRHLLEEGRYCDRIAGVLALEGSGTGVAVTRALGSRRFRVTVSGPGGHSWTDAGLPNPIVLIGRVLAQLDRLELPPHTTFSPGMIAGGTSINSIPESAAVSLDLRSTEAARLDWLAGEVAAAFAQAVAPPAWWTIETVGERPAAVLPEEADLLHTLRAVDRHLGIRTELRLGSTDANLPLARGIPAAAVAAGGVGGGIHTLAEWYDPTGRELALRRILLILLGFSQMGPAHLLA